GQQRQQPVAEVMREEEYPMPAEKPRTVDDVGASLANQLDQRRKFFGRVLEVRVLNDDQIAPNGAEARTKCRPLAAVFRLQQQREPELTLESRENISRSVARTVIDD